MPLTDPQRIQRERSQPRILQLWQAIQPLKSVIGFMNTGAHPDDETSAMLAAIGFRDGLQLSFACANRGEGGQNNIGSETGTELGALRTAEMERASDVLNMRLYWLSENPDDSITDFGFSKSGTETLAHWGAARTLTRFVQIVRTERPDIICPTFLDVPGQHGHHRAMTAMAHQVMVAAADPKFAADGLAPWQVSKLYLPAWSGAGQSYDDDLPPPPATLVVDGKGLDPVTGWSWERIAQHSRAFHATQGMGHWVPAGAERNWPLHLALSHVDGPDADLSSGLPATLADLAAVCSTPELAAPLTRAQNAIEEIFDSFPALVSIKGQASRALREIEAALPIAPELVRHRLLRKQTQLSHVVRLAAGVEVITRTSVDWLESGSKADLQVEARNGTADAVKVDLDLADGCSVHRNQIEVEGDATPSPGYPDTYDPLAPPAPSVVVTVTCDGKQSSSRIALETAPVILPRHRASLSPKAALLNTARPLKPIQVNVTDRSPADAAASMNLPARWTIVQSAQGFELTAPAGVPEGVFECALSLDDSPAVTATRISHPHVAPRLLCAPAVLRVRTAHVELPDARVGYIGGGHDHVAHWMRVVGLDVTELTDADIGDAEALAAYDTLVVGIFAFRFRPSLSASLPRLHAWVRDGGNLVTLYHRPWDSWNADATALARLEIGQPSLRWRVTDDNAAVTPLVPDHPILSGPNPITDADWQGWVKERGLYFASNWDAAYAPLLEMNDPEEAPLRGALLAGRFGRGQHVHCALILHHQMENLVPGAFRLMANLVTPPV